MSPQQRLPFLAVSTLRVWSLPVLIGAVVLTGCGRKATQADCDFIFDRYVEVQLRAMNITDQAIIEKRKVEMRAEMKDDLRECAGKRISDRMLTCVKDSRTNEEIDQCTRW